MYMIVPLKDHVLKRGVSCRLKGEVKKEEEEEEEEAGGKERKKERKRKEKRKKMKRRICCGNKLSLSCTDRW